MKKILILLIGVLFTISNLNAQSRLDYSAVNTVTQVGDTLIVKFQYFKGDKPDAKLYQFDFQYNNKLLTPIARTWRTTSTSAQRAINNWNGFKFNPDANKTLVDYDGQYTSWLGGTASYSANADWSVERITYQDVTSLVDGAEFIQYSFRIKDKQGTTYTNYTNLLNANWANYKQADGALIDVTKGNSNHMLSLSNILGGAAGNVTINILSNVITNNIGNGTDFGYTIYTKANFDSGITQNTPIVASGNFDASGQATVAGLTNDVEYFVSTHINSQRPYLNNAVTVSDLALIFREAIGAGSSPNGTSTTFDYAAQRLLGNVVNPSGVNFQDSYEVLAYLQGVVTNNQNLISKTGNAYNVSGVASTFGNRDANGNPTFNSIIKPTDANKTFSFGHALIGDVNFSHGFQPTSQTATINSAANKSSAVALMSSAKYVPQSANIDLVSELRNGKVVFSINSNVVGMVGSQFNIVYDKARIKLDDVVFDTGNTMTNFANHIEADGIINIGSFDQNFTSTVKAGTPYRLVFTPLVQLNNTSGLISFKVNEGVRADGTQIKFVIK